MPLFPELAVYCFAICPSVKPAVHHKACPRKNWRTLQITDLKLGREVDHHKETTLVNIEVIAGQRSRQP